ILPTLAVVLPTSLPTFPAALPAPLTAFSVVFTAPFATLPAPLAAPPAALPTSLAAPPTVFTAPLAAFLIEPKRLAEAGCADPSTAAARKPEIRAKRRIFKDLLMFSPVRG